MVLRSGGEKWGRLPFLPPALWLMFSLSPGLAQGPRGKSGPEPSSGTTAFNNARQGAGYVGSKA
ncbi:MAG: hypothetical protein ACREP9_08185, partial [Candidatus Dormibacteraceae bacterium]